MVDPKDMLMFFLPEGLDLSRYDIADAKHTPDPTIAPFVGRLEFWLEEKNIVPE